jgi:signal transduction histidine kinase
MDILFRKVISCFILFFLVTQFSYAEKNVYYFFSNKDIPNDKVLERFKAGESELYPKTIENLNFTDSSVYWVYIPPISINETAHYFLNENAGFDSIIVYQLINNELTPVDEFGLKVKYKKNINNPNFYSYDLSYNEHYFIKYKNTSRAGVTFSIYSYQELIHFITIEKIKTGIYWGFLLIMAIMVLMFYSQVKEPIYLAYFGFIVGLFLISFSIRGYTYAVFYPNHPEWNHYKYGIIALSASFTVWFVYYFLDVKKFYPPLANIYKYLFAGFSSIFIFNFFSTPELTLYLIQIVGLFQVTTFLTTAIVVYRKGNNMAIFFIIGWITYLTASIYISLASLNLVPIYRWTNYSLEYASAIEIAFFSFAIAERFKNYKFAEAQKQKELINVLQEREILLNLQNEILENEVKRRTEEIHNQNLQLQHLNKDLNLIVEDRTTDLKKILLDKENTNNQLQQFTYITSHNLRGPIASLKGLINLYYNSTDSEEKEHLVKKLGEVVETMNLVLTDLNDILTQKDIASHAKEEIDIKELVQEIRSLLSYNDYHIHFDLQHTQPIISIRAFFHSILYNIISNAIKYKKENQLAHISISTFEERNKLYLKIADNGIGIDLTKHAEKIFGFYKRFNQVAEGKGIGLFITKTQIELMGGKISVDSIPNVGTTFTIELPIVKPLISD